VSVRLGDLRFVCLVPELVCSDSIVFATISFGSLELCDSKKTRGSDVTNCRRMLDAIIDIRYDMGRNPLA